MRKMVNLFDEALNLLRARRVEFVDRFIPYYLCSYACHLINLENRKRHFYYEHDRLPDLRLHVLMTAPAGFSKSFFLKQLLHPVYGLLNDGGVPMHFEGYCTEAGFIGSVERVAGQVVKIKGLAEEYKDGIIGIEEFFAIMQAMEQKHSLHYEPALNQALIDGDVRKRLRGGSIEYKTNITLWAGTQSTRFKVGGGLLRRFLLINWVPKRWEQKALKSALWAGVNLKLEEEKLQDFHDLLTAWRMALSRVESVEFTEDFRDLVMPVEHFRQPILMKLGIGYWLLLDDPQEKLVVDHDERLAHYIDQANEWWEELVGDPECNVVLEVLRDLGGVASWQALKRHLLRFSISYSKSDELIRLLIRRGEIEYESRNRLLRLKEG